MFYKDVVNTNPPLGEVYLVSKDSTRGGRCKYEQGPFNLIVTKAPRLFRHIMLIWHSFGESANVDSGIVAFPAAAPVTAQKIVSYTI
jgi:hypothetical protein